MRAITRALAFAFGIAVLPMTGVPASASCSANWEGICGGTGELSLRYHAICPTSEPAETLQKALHPNR